MANEVTVKIWQRNINQALLVDEKEWEINLSELRDLLKIQGIQVPRDYRFLTCTGNIVSTTLEQTIEFKDILTPPTTSPLTLSSTKGEQATAFKADDLNLNEKCKSGLQLAGQICIFETDGTESPSYHNCTCNMNIPGPPSASPPPGPGSGIDDENVNIGQEQPQDPPAAKENEGCHGCPALILKKCCPFLYDTLKPKLLFKAVLLLPIVLIVFMAALTLTLHMIFGITGSFSQNAVFSSLLTKPPDIDTNTWVNMKVKLSELEMAYKFEIQDVQRKISDLEDLYLRDLEVQRRELTQIKNKQVDGDSTIAQKLQDVSVKLEQIILLLRSYDKINGNIKVDDSFKEDGGAEKFKENTDKRNGFDKKKNGNQKKKGI